MKLLHLTFSTYPIKLRLDEKKVFLIKSDWNSVISQLLLEFNKFNIIWQNVIAFTCSVKLQCTIQASVICPIFFLAQEIDIFCNSSLNHA